MSIIGIISWAIFGLVAGLVARAVKPGADGVSTLMTIILGIGGALAGGFIASALGVGPATEGSPWSLWHFLVAVAGAVLLLVIYQALSSGRS